MFGVGLADGESCERFWSIIRHYIPSLKASYGSVRRQTITYVALYKALIRHCGLPKTLAQKFKEALKKILEMKRKLNAFYSETHMTQTELEEQACLMDTHYRNPPAECKDIESEICELLKAKKLLEEWNETAANMSKDSQLALTDLQFRATLRMSTSGRVEITIDTQPEELMKRVRTCLTKCGKSLSLWQNPDGTLTDYYFAEERRLPFLELRTLKMEIWSLLIARKSEQEEIHRSGSLGILSIITLTLQALDMPAV